MSSNYNAIVEDQPGLRTFASGKEDGPVILFVHGWPDDHVLWDAQVRAAVICALSLIFVMYMLSFGT